MKVGDGRYPGQVRDAGMIDFFDDGAASLETEDFMPGLSVGQSANGMITLVIQKTLLLLLVLPFALLWRLRAFLV